MRGAFVLPLYPLEGAVLLPGARCTVTGPGNAVHAAIERARSLGGAVIASLADGESVHEIGVTAMIADEDDGATALHGVGRCRLIALVDDEVLMVRAERYPEAPVAEGRRGPVARLLHARYERLRLRIGREGTGPVQQDLSALTWRITADLGLPAEQQQGFLNVPDPLTRARLLLVAVRELERRERFLRPWAHLRRTNPWN
jgi:hypothetical protein